MPGGSDIVYPQGCRPINEELGSDELIRRLKTLAHTLQGMGQDEGMYQQYIPLALHIADDHFLSHESKDVQLLIACCIADVLRVYAPEAPYKDPEQVKTIFLFLIKQLNGLKDPKDPAFKRYFYLLENLAYVKSFNMCFELEDSQEIFCALFSLMFKIVNDEHSGKVKSFMLDVLCPLITESDILSHELLDIILMNIVDPLKSQRKNAYMLAKELIVKTNDTLEPYIQNFFNSVLILGKEERSLNISAKIYDLIYELYKMCPKILSAVLPQLECKLKSNNEQERLQTVSLLARMFSEEHSTLAQQHSQLWKSFLGRFNDISASIRIKCVQYSMHFLLNHPELRQDIVDTLKLRQHDADENVRYEVVTAIVTTARRDFDIVSSSEDLLTFVKERTLDKKFKIRKEALTGLAMIYKNHLNDEDCPQATKKAVTWIKDKILHGYYMTSLDDRVLVERLLNTSLVPYTLGPDERMKKLYHLFGTINDHATKAFIELQKTTLVVRNAVRDWTELHRKPQENAKEIQAKIISLSRFLPEPIKAQEFLIKFSKNIIEDTKIMGAMELLSKPDVTCKECLVATTIVLRKLGNPVMTNLYYNNIKLLLERATSCLIDSQAIPILISYVDDCLNHGNLIDELGLHPGTAGERGLKLLVMLSYVYPCHFMQQTSMQALLKMLHIDDEIVAPLVFSVLSFLGKYKPLGEVFKEEMKQLVPICQDMIEKGTPKQAKQAIRCLYKNLGEHYSIDIVDENSENGVKTVDLFADILEKIKMNLTPESPNFRTAIIALGHIAYNMPNKFPAVIKNTVSRKIVKELLIKETEESFQYNNAWVYEEELPNEVRCKMEGLKMMARWLLGLKAHKESAQKTFRMLNALILHKGDLLQSNKMSKQEMAWMRLSAGCAMLKICEQKGVGDQYSPEQFYNLSRLLIDEVPEVREIFANKLHKGLGRNLPNKCLPLDFMGFYALGGLEEEKKLKNTLRTYMTADIARRREYAKNLLLGTGGLSTEKAMAQLPNFLPDFMLVFAVPVLTHTPVYTSNQAVDELMVMRACLWFILEPLLNQPSESFSVSFFKEMIDQMKNCRDALNPDDESTNHKMRALCDLASNIISTKAPSFDNKEFPAEIRIPPMYFKKTEGASNMYSSISYLPEDLQLQTKGKGLSESGNMRGRGATSRKKQAASRLNSSETDVEPSEASESQIKLPGMDVDSDGENGEPEGKRRRMKSNT